MLHLLLYVIAIVSGCQWFLAHLCVVVSGTGNREPDLPLTVFKCLHSSTDVDGTSY